MFYVNGHRPQQTSISTFLAVQGVKRVVGICFKVVLKLSMNYKISFAPISDLKSISLLGHAFREKGSIT